MLYHAPAYTVSKKLPRKLGSGTFAIAPYEAFKASDGEIVIAAGNDNLFRKLADVLGKPDWKDDARFTTNGDRVVNREILSAMISEIVATDTAGAWAEKLEAVNIPCAPVQTIDKVLAHPQTKALNILHDDPNGSTYFDIPVRINGARPQGEGKPPKLGEHNSMLEETPVPKRGAAS